MSKLLKLCPLVALVGLGSWLGARPPGQTQATPAALADLAWMAGHWSVDLGPVRVEEVWLAPAGGFLLGMNRTSKKEGRGQFEYLRIEQRNAEIFYVASPGGRAPTDFKLTEHGKDFALFSNPEHDFPKDIRYELTAAGELKARVSGAPGGKEHAEEWTWKRVQ